MLLSEVEKIYDRIEKLLKGRYGISHVTLQAEVDRCCDKDICETS
jgi:cobalt-zinc-cadmium efflux system protein